MHGVGAQQHTYDRHAARGHREGITHGMCQAVWLTAVVDEAGDVALQENKFVQGHSVVALVGLNLLSFLNPVLHGTLSPGLVVLLCLMNPRYTIVSTH
jgi:acyl dehydratase